jgi:hypothetical protein
MEKQQVFYIHGGSSYSKYEDYIDDLKHVPLRSTSNKESSKRWTQEQREVLGASYEVFMPEMPNKQNSKYEEWKIWFERHFELLCDDLILVCWSQGSMFMVKYLSENETPFSIKHLFLLSTPYEYFVLEGMKEDGGDFYPAADRIPSIEDRVENITIMHSKDDFVVPYEHALKYKEALPEAELVTFEDKNHFLVEELPELVERIKQLL